MVFLVNRRHSSNTKEDNVKDENKSQEPTKETVKDENQKEESEKQKAESEKQKQDRNNPLSTHYHTSLPVEKHSIAHVFDPIPQAAKMPSLWLFLVAILVIKSMLTKQSEGIADDLCVLLRRYDEAKESKDENQILKAETMLIQFVNMASLLFLMGNPKLSNSLLLEEICDFLLKYTQNTQLTELMLTMLTTVAHCSKSTFDHANIPLSTIATKFSDKELLRDTNIVSSLAQFLDTLIIDGYDLGKMASAPGVVSLIDLMAHHPDAGISTRASHIFKALARNPASGPAVKDRVGTFIHVIKRQDNEESVVYAKEAIQGLLELGKTEPEVRTEVEKQLYDGTVSQELVNEIMKFERPVTMTKIPRFASEMTLAILLAVGWGYLRWTRALKKRGVSAADIKKIVPYRTALTAATTAVAVGSSILEDNVLAHHSEIASDVVAFIGWPLFLAVTPFIIIPSFLSAIVSAQAFDKICDEHRR